MATVLKRLNNSDQVKAPVDLFTGDPIEITDTYQDISKGINVKGVGRVALWLQYDANSSTDTKVRCLAYSEDPDENSSAAAYEFVIETVSASKVDVQGENIEIVDADLNFIREFVLNEQIPFIKFQVKDSADGTGQIESAKLSYGKLK